MTGQQTGIRALAFAPIGQAFPILDHAEPVVVFAWLTEPSPPGPAVTAILSRGHSLVSRVEVIGPRGNASHDAPGGLQAIAGPGPSTEFQEFVRRQFGLDLTDFTPWQLYQLTSAESSFGLDVLLASRLRDSGIVFTRTESASLDALPDGADLLAITGKPRADLVQCITSESLNFTHFEPGTEIEVKLGLPEDASIWPLSLAFYHRVQDGRLDGFLPDVGNEMQRWQFAIQMYEVLEPPAERGYLSFSPNPDGAFVVHRKRGADGLRRQEWSQRDIVVPDGDFDHYLAEHHPELRTRRLPAFERTRFDVNLESARYGHFYGIEIDEVWVPSRNRRLHQLELEYHRTRVHADCSDRAIVEELERLTGLVQQALTEMGVAHQRYYYSKLSFLRDLVTDASAHP